MTFKFNIKRGAVQGALTVLFVLTLTVGAFARDLVPVGRAVGIEMSTDGVLVSGIARLETAAGEASPAEDAGILPGDIIFRLGTSEVRTAQDFLTAAGGFTGEPVAVTLRRCGKTIQYTVTPAQTTDGSLKLGLRLRDGVTGIGTITFYDPETGLFAALGHPISDVDTGVMLPLGGGFITGASVTDVKKGQCGAPGELHGAFDTQQRLGTLIGNTRGGIFGYMTAVPSGQAVPTASSEEISTGAATILAQVDGGEAREYAVEIARVYRGGEERLMLRVTDAALLEATGGIVQGMSGCPILQDGKLVGAVTHVLLSDPTRGYGITIGAMLSAANDCIPSKNAA